MKRLLLTGASGLLASHVLPLLQEAGYEVFITHRPGYTGAQVDDVTAVELELGLEQGWQTLPSSIDVVVHCAAMIPASFTDLSQAERLWQVNGLGTLRLLRWAREQGASRFVYASSHAVYARPYPYPIPEDHATYPSGHAVPYALSKLAGELFVTSMQATNFQVCSLRFPTLYGAGKMHGGVLSRFISLAAENQPIQVTAPAGSLFDFLYVQDAAQAVLAAIRADLCHTVYNIGCGRGVTLLELAQAVWTAFAPSTPPQIKTVTDDASPTRAVLDVTRAQQDLHYRPAYTPDSALSEMKNKLLS